METEESVLTLTALSHKVIRSIWHLPDAGSTDLSPQTRLIAPVNKKGSMRLSEQEARFAYCNILNSSGLFYSVETPTQEMYKQKGRAPSTASTDLTVYSLAAGQFRKALNIELKYGNPRFEVIRKDVEKLIREGLPGGWFHLLRNVHRSTLQVVFRKILDSMKVCFAATPRDDISILFSVCVFQARWGATKHFHFTSADGSIDAFAEGFFALDYSVKRGRILVHDARGWDIVE